MAYNTIMSAMKMPPNSDEKISKFTKEQLEEFKETFLLFDKDGDGVITTKEVKTVLRSLGQDPSSKELQQTLENVDTDGNGCIEFSEFLNLMVLLLNDVDTEDELVEVFRMIDQDGDGYISRGDLREIVVRIGLQMTSQEMEEMIIEADKDGDQQINYEEFLKIVTSRA